MAPGADRYPPPDKQSDEELYCDEEGELTPDEQKEQDRPERDDWEYHRDR